MILFIKSNKETRRFDQAYSKTLREFPISFGQEKENISILCLRVKIILRIPDYENWINPKL
jgi:hypothetical protein